MAKKVKTVSALLDELDKPLYEARWKDIEQILKKTKKKVAIPEAFTYFLQGLELVENRLLGHGTDDSRAQSTEASSVHPDKVLQEAESRLRRCISLCQPGYDASLQLLAKIKLGQLLWFRRDYREAAGALQELQGTATADLLLLHTLKVVMEGNLYSGLCFECLAAESHDRTYKFLQAISAYETSLGHALSLIHHIKTTPGQTVMSQHPATLKAVQTVVERGPVLALKMNSRVRALNIYRTVLLSKDDDVLHDARMMCATSLSSLLLFHSSPEAYHPPKVSSHSFSFSPRQLSEETILVSQLANAITNTWTVSKADPTPSPAVILDLTILSLTDVQLRGQIVQLLEEALQFACDLPHVWLQFALALVANAQNEQALAVFHECVSLSPTDPLILTTAAQFAVEKALNPQLCIKWASKAVQVVRSHFLEPRVEFLLGRGYTTQAQMELSSQKRGELHKKGVEHLKRAAALDPQNVDYAFHLALQLAVSREFTPAQDEVKRALSLNAGHTSCLHLLALILTAQKKYIEALKVCDFALQKQPDNFGLLECKAKLEVVIVNTHQALKTCKHALHLWQTLFAEDTSGLIGMVTQDQLSLSELNLTSFERAVVHDGLSPDIASDTGSSHFSLNTGHMPTNQPNLLQARIWCTIAEVFVSAGKIPDAISCVREAQYLAPHLSSVLITHGRVLEAEGNPDLALEQYRNSMSLQPGNPTALTLIGQLLHRQGRHSEAEKYLREATAIDQLNHEAWYWLGEVFSIQGEEELGVNCFKTSLDLEQTTPIQPFTAVLSSFVPPS